MKNNAPAVIGGGVYLPPGHPDTASVREAATMPNPEYAKHQMLVMRGKIPSGSAKPPRTIQAWSRIPDQDPWAGGTIAPRKIGGWSGHYADRQSEGEHADIAISFALRDYQREAISMLKQKCEGVVVAPCGSGKTAIGCGAIAALQRTTLVLVHTIDLREQWMARLKSDLLGAHHPAVQVSTIQSLYRMPWRALYQWGSQFGLVILDEAHHAPAMTFSRVLSALPAKWRLGLTATPDRDDGLSRIIDWHFGSPSLYKVDHQALVAGGHLVTPNLVVVRTEWQPDNPDAHWATIIRCMIEDSARNSRIAGLVANEVSAGRQVLVLSDRVSHCEEIAGMCGGEALVGKKSVKARNAIMARALSRESMVITATSVADEGLDLPSLDTVILATPTKALGRLQQRIGRIMRPKAGKNPRVFDLVDNWGPLLHQYQRRKSLYWRLGIEEQNEPPARTA